MPYEDDPSSFLFGLNQFASPPQDSQNDERSSASQNMLAGLEAFASDDLGGPAQGAETGAQAPNFADQLALWTNANFSFDGPTGHALIGDEEKEKEEAEHNRRREEENRRNEEEDRERMARNAAASSRGGNAARGKAREIASQNDGLGQNQHSFQMDGHQNGHAPQQQPPSFMAQHQAKPPQAPQSAFAALQNQRSPQAPNAAMNGQQNGAFHPFFNSLPNFNQLNSAPQHHSPQAAPANGMPHLDMTSALALQHLLTSNPLALASLGQFAGFTNPQLQAQLALLVGGGLNLGAFGQQPTAPSNGPSQAPSPWEAHQQASQQQSRQGSQSAPSGVPSSWPVQMPTLPSGSGPLANGAGSAFGSANSGASSAHGADTHESATVPTKKKRVSTANGKKATNGSEDFSDEELGMKQEDIDRKYEIPPLKLIDTGNPEADAEANRLAIEEDKRRRNTAASARFRIKKKQREAALEHTAKELQQRLADLESENARLRTENGWLKSLITVQPGQSSAQRPATPEPAPYGPAAGPSGTSGQPDAASYRNNAQPPAASSNAGAQEQPERNSGLVPRGVGTDPSQKDGAHLKRDRED